MGNDDGPRNKTFTASQCRRRHSSRSNVYNTQGSERRRKFSVGRKPMIWAVKKIFQHYSLLPPQESGKKLSSSKAYPRLLATQFSIFTSESCTDNVVVDFGVFSIGKEHETKLLWFYEM